MTIALQTVEALLPQMSVVNDLSGLFPGIEKTEQVCGGEARIARTRIPVWLLVRQRQLGLSDEVILDGYPTLRAEDLSNAWNYNRAHREEIEENIRENEADNQLIRINRPNA